MGRRKRSAVDIDTYDDFEQPPSPTRVVHHRHTDYTATQNGISARRSYYTTGKPLTPPVLLPLPVVIPEDQLMRDDDGTDNNGFVEADSDRDVVDPTLRARFRKRTIAGVCPFNSDLIGPDTHSWLRIIQC